MENKFVMTLFVRIGCGELNENPTHNQDNIAHPSPTNPINRLVCMGCTNPLGARVISSI